MAKLKRKDIPTEIKEFLKDHNVFKDRKQAYFKSLAKQLKQKNWLSEVQISKVQDTLSNK